MFIQRFHNGEILSNFLSIFDKAVLETACLPYVARKRLKNAKKYSVIDSDLAGKVLSSFKSITERFLTTLGRQAVSRIVLSKIGKAFDEFLPISPA